MGQISNVVGTYGTDYQYRAEQTKKKQQQNIRDMTLIPML